MNAAFRHTDADMIQSMDSLLLLLGSPGHSLTSTLHCSLQCPLTASNVITSHVPQHSPRQLGYMSTFLFKTCVFLFFFFFQYVNILQSTLLFHFHYLFLAYLSFFLIIHSPSFGSILPLHYSTIPPSNHESFNLHCSGSRISSQQLSSRSTLPA